MCPLCQDEKKLGKSECRHCSHRFDSTQIMTSRLREDPSTNIKCPHCAEEVKLEAIKCKHCGSEIQRTKSSKTFEERKKDAWVKSAEKSYYAGAAALCLIIIAFLSIGILSVSPSQIKALLPTTAITGRPACDDANVIQSFRQAFIDSAKGGTMGLLVLLRSEEEKAKILKMMNPNTIEVRFIADEIYACTAEVNGSGRMSYTILSTNEGTVIELGEDADYAAGMYMMGILGKLGF